jgi:KaiC/GvpD/RAD55 family RecA-like ATPase
MAKNEKKIEEQAEQIVSPELEAIKAQIAKMIADAKAEAEAIVENAKEQAKAVAEGKPAMSEEAKKVDEYWNEEVEIQLFKDSGKYKDDVYVAVNGQNCLIQRGKPVRVKRKYAETLRRSLEQDNETADMIRELSENYEERADKLN